MLNEQAHSRFWLLSPAGYGASVRNHVEEKTADERTVVFCSWPGPWLSTQLQSLDLEKPVSINSLCILAKKGYKAECFQIGLANLSRGPSS